MKDCTASNPRPAPLLTTQEDLDTLLPEIVPAQGEWTEDLVLEVVSPDRSERDLVTERGDYAEAGIPENWIVDPQAETIAVPRLEGDTYAEHGVLGRGTRATSLLLEGFAVEVDAVFDVA